MVHLTLQILLDGFVLSAILALSASGLTIIFGVAGVINLAHGSIMITAALIAWLCATTLGVNTYLSACIGILSAVMTSYLLYFTIVVPLERSPRITNSELPMFIFVATLMAAIIINGVLTWGIGPSSVVTPPTVRGVTRVSGVTIPTNWLFLAAVSCVTLACMWFFITRTRSGKAMLAASMSPTGLAIIGYDIGWVRLMVWGIYGLLAGISGVLYASFTSVSPVGAIDLTASALTIVILGGLGNILGSLLGACILGYVATLTTYLISPSVSDIPGLVIMFLVLYFMPQGLLGRR